MVQFSAKKLGDIASVVGGEISNSSHRDLVVESIAQNPQSSTTADLVFLYEEKYIKKIAEVKAKAFILPAFLKDKLPPLSIPVIWVKRPRLVLKMLLESFECRQYKAKVGIHEKAVVDPDAKVGKNCAIGAGVFVGPGSLVGDGSVINPNSYIGSNVSIGKNCLIHANCTILDNVKIGNNVILHSGVVVGSDGYSYVTEEESNLEKAKKGNFEFNLGRQIQHKIPSIGGVIIEEDVEIGANSCVDSGTIGPTIIGAGTKVDNLVQIAHNCKIGKDCLIVGQVGFAGSVTLGDRVIAGGQSGFADNMTVGSDVIFLAKSGVHGNIQANSVYMGMPAVPYKEFVQQEMNKKRIPRKQEKLEKKIDELEAKLKQLEEKLQVKA